MKNLSQIWFQVQHDLFPYLEKEFQESLTPVRRQLLCPVRVNYLIRFS